VTRSFRGRGARAGALAGCVTVVLLLPGCVLFHHGHRNDVGCRQAPFNGNAQTLPPLKAPPGLNAPSATTAVKIPTLDAQAAPRPRTAPCLDFPPKYVPETPTPPVRRVPQPVQ
jgi:uncharacterized lipoprotein